MIPTSVSILVSVSLIFSSCTLASSRIRPFSRLRSSLIEFCARMISSRKRELSFAISDERRSYSARVAWYSVEWWVWRSERSCEKSTFSTFRRKWLVSARSNNREIVVLTGISYFLLFCLGNHSPGETVDTNDREYS